MEYCDGPKAAPGCCGGSDDTRSKVREGYARIASGGGSCCGPKSCCASNATADDVARAAGYSDEDLGSLPDGANMGLSCGNPTALASLGEGEVVLDLGSGGGFDCFIAARKVGSEGRVIGVDMTPEMVSKARGNAEAFRSETGLDNIEFRLGEIEHLPVADSSVDVVISNCVVNLSPEKPQVWREIARVLKPSGRVAISDLALLKPLPEAVRSSVEALVGCIAGAVLVEETRRMVEDASLVEADLSTESGYIDQMADALDPLFREVASMLPPGSKPGDFVTSLKVSARKPVNCDEVEGHEGRSGMDEKTKELVAIGASVAGHCQPCLSYHVTKARELGVEDVDIQIAVDVGHMVEKGAMSAMREFAKSATGASPEKTAACCGGASQEDNERCCG